MTRCGHSILALVGLRCTGKSTVGRRVALAAGARWVDLDDVLAERFGLSGAGEVIETHGLATFRAAEAEALAEALTRSGPERVVVATGGGAIESEASRARLRQDAFTVWLRGTPEVLAARLEQDAAHRPSLAGHAPLEEFRELLARREPLYRDVSRRAFSVDEVTPEELAVAVERAWLE